jgi:hypothetical protein
MRLHDFRRDPASMNRHATLMDDRFVAECLDISLTELNWRAKDATGAAVTAAAYKMQGAMELIEIFRNLSRVPTETPPPLYQEEGLANPDEIRPLAFKPKPITKPAHA